MNKFYLSFATVGVVTHVLWGYVVPLVNEGILVDSFSHRLIISSPFIALIIFHVIYKKLNIEYITYCGILLLTADYCYLVAINNRPSHTTGLYVMLTASLAVINKRSFLWLYISLFTVYCFYEILFISSTVMEYTNWGNMLTLIVLMTFFGLWRIRNLENLNSEYKSNLEKSKKLEELNNIAAQAAHDIRSPVMALKSFTSSFTGIDEKKLKIVTDATQRVNEIADYLVDEYRQRFTTQIEKNESVKNIFDEQTVSEMIESLKEEKIASQSPFKRYKFFVHGNIQYKIQNPKFQFELKRVLSNIINNSIEAFENTNGIIDIMLSESNGSFTIEIKDNGKGIPKELVEKIYDRGASYNKLQGSGLGLAHAKETIEKFEGKISLSSKQNIGTLVQITFSKI